MAENVGVRDVRHVKAARELLRWDQGKMAEMARLSLVSVRRYEGGRLPVNDGIERAIIDALEQAGVVFVPMGYNGVVETSGGVILRASAKPEPIGAKTIYVYSDAERVGRPKGVREKAARKTRRPVTGRKASSLMPGDQE